MEVIFIYLFFIFFYFAADNERILDYNNQWVQKCEELKIANKKFHDQMESLKNKNSEQAEEIDKLKAKQDTQQGITLLVIHNNSFH